MTEVSDMQGEAERAGTVQPGEKKAQGDLRGEKRRGSQLFSVLFRCRTKGNGH